MARQIIDLGGDDWQVGRSPPTADPHRAAWQELEQVDEWLPATVPGNIRADLVRAGRLPDLHPGRQVEAAQWVDDHCWWLSRDFSLDLTPDRRVHLVLRGVDYLSDLFLNGHHLGRHEGMFSPQVYDVTRCVQADNRLAVRIVGSRWLPADRSTAWGKLLNRIESRLVGLSDRFPDRRDTLKCQMGFGWDFAPPLRTMGLWDDLFLVIGGDPFIRDLVVRQRGDEEEGRLAVMVEMDARQAAQVRVRCLLTGETFEAEPVVMERPAELLPGGNCCPVELAIHRPRLWWPWDHGQPDLYRLTVEVEGSGRLLDRVTHTVGLRQVGWENGRLSVNGRRIYARGANWVPANILPGLVNRDDYHALLTLARQANMNLLRVWGGGLREKAAFYDLCDRLGILVWQEFPFACAFIAPYPRSREYLRLVEAEARAIVRDLRHHPCLALWCGGNEFSPRRNAPLVATLQRVVAAEDPTRPFLPASPADGDRHNWLVWHHFQPPAAYRRDTALFASEFGLQAPPEVESLRRFIPAEELWPPGPAWTCHGAGLNKLWRYARPFLAGRPVSCEEFVRASQRAQAHGLQIAIEHYRRRKAQGCGGALVWQLNEPWPAISWALLDFYRRPKPAYETVKRLFNPLLVSLDYPLQQYKGGDELCADVWLLNDRHEALDGCLVEVLLWDGQGQAVERFTCILDVAADSAAIVGQVDWLLPPGGGWRVTCRLSRGGQVLTANEYDLAVHDDLQPTPGQRLWTWLSFHMGRIL